MYLKDINFIKFVKYFMYYVISQVYSQVGNNPFSQCTGSSTQWPWRMPIPTSDPDILNKVSKAKAKYFTKLDVRWGYNNIWIKEGDEWKAAFQTNWSLFEPLVMFFGLTNSPATFQTMMNNIFKELINEGVVTIYMDNILIFSGQTWEQHREIVVWVLNILRKHRLYLKVEKCTF